MELLLTVKAEKVDLIFDKLLILDDNLLDWVQYYKKPYIIAFLNPNISKISYDSWHATPNNMNCAESAHAMSNCEGKQLKLMIAILSQDKSGIARKKLAIKRSTNSSIKRQNKKQRISKVIDLTDETSQEFQNNNELRESSMMVMEKLKYEERMLIIAERKEKLREL
ncbi:1620_t:CDS:2 [Racocetra persica]|uniref:1620_t:CDS:1 n=1 Tax=Racocetra persica TaxID=160502 RepID=A0ACA9MTQ7_9GLOM|nr:1620_t:CDS:2 [Racocetra persica]